MGARGEIVVRVAMTGRAGIDESRGGSCGKLLGVRCESRWVRGQLACVLELRYSVLALLGCCE
ncbi:hypothetical protein Taro_033464 [Colocasia esculenta]|uniref:Uncharacterized protein n=1 Tax=Colocasia esculenta TaxID=4460 RepID=A0A843W4T4_COLES|nr:hypothetical protein [Colocasia esculenta]